MPPFFCCWVAVVSSAPSSPLEKKFSRCINNIFLGRFGNFVAVVAVVVLASFHLIYFFVEFVFSFSLSLSFGIESHCY